MAREITRHDLRRIKQAVAVQRKNGHDVWTDEEVEREGFVLHRLAQLRSTLAVTDEKLLDIALSPRCSQRATEIVPMLQKAREVLQSVGQQAAAEALAKNRHISASKVLPLLRHEDPLVVDAAEQLLAQISGHGHFLEQVMVGKLSLKLRTRGFAGIACRLWASGKAAAKACAERRYFDVTGKRVLELGCGVGIVGITCAALGAKHVVLTDCDPSALELARLSAELNGVTAHAETRTLDWNSEADRHAVVQSDAEPFEVIVASDVIYDEGQSKGLVLTLVQLLTANSANTSSRALIVLQSDTRRSAEAAAELVEFEREMSQTSLRCLYKESFDGLITDRNVDAMFHTAPRSCSVSSGDENQSGMDAEMYTSRETVDGVEQRRNLLAYVFAPGE
mmetsp:Transcript_44760/g.74247  ORF Transcript_44760/g.74247 Transcript_44760/m.74247 type:complete len:393 (+) Transcript_44760:71-1249(+)